MTFRSTKTFGHELGLSAAFRQWRATHSHCSKLHGYALSIKLTFEALYLDDKNWVVDFGGLKELKKRFEDTFDHKTLVAKDDPQLEWFRQAHTLGVLDLVEVDAVGCERFAELVSKMTDEWLVEQKLSSRIRLVETEVREHGSNSAIHLDSNSNGNCGCACSGSVGC